MLAEAPQKLLLVVLPAAALVEGRGRGPGFRRQENRSNREGEGQSKVGMLLME